MAFYLRPDVRVVFEEYIKHLAELYGKVVRATDDFDRDLKRMTLDGYVRGFGETANLVPIVFVGRDLEMVFDTIVNERVDTGYDFEDPSLASIAGSLSFEEFKKSMIRIASIVTV